MKMATGVILWDVMLVRQISCIALLWTNAFFFQYWETSTRRLNSQACAAKIKSKINRVK